MDLVSFYECVLQLPKPWHVKRVECFQEAGRVDVWLEHEHVMFRCPKCMCECPIQDHLPERVWRHLDTCGYQTFLHANLPRIKCATDGKRTAWIPFATPQTSVSEAMERKCIETMRECSMIGAENLTGVSVRRLERIRAIAVERGLKRRDESELAKIGIDEKQVFSRHRYFTILTDQVHRRVYDVVDSRKLEKIRPWFDENAHLIRHVETVAMDMSAGYASIAAERMPDAAICYDRFHVVQAVNLAVDATRKDEQRSMSTEKRKAMFGNRFCFLYAKENMPDKQRERFEEVARVATKTARAWRIKEMLRDMLAMTPMDFEAAFPKWYWWATHSRLKHIAKVAKTLKSHYHGLMNAIEFGITNALAEGLNSKIESVKRMACGYKNKAHFRIAILFHCGKLDMLPNLVM